MISIWNMSDPQQIAIGARDIWKLMREGHRPVIPFKQNAIACIKMQTFFRNFNNESY